jgi:hypothetical protein
MLDGCSSIYELANLALARGTTLSHLSRQLAKLDLLDYDPIYAGASEWRILPAVDHPEEPARCLVSGTGLTHLGSARNRQSMHEARPEDLTDSMKMFRWGVEGGRAYTGMCRRCSRVVLQGHGHHAKGAWRTTWDSVLRRGRG